MMKMSKIISKASLILLISSREVVAEDLTCSLSDLDEQDPALKELTYDVGDGPQTMLAYVEPDITSFYQGVALPASTKVVPKFNGLAGKFINMSNRHVRLYWEPYEGGPPNLMKHYAPFSAGGTATFPGHRFFFTPEEDPSTRLQAFIIQDYPENIYIYDPFVVTGNDKETEKNLQPLTKAERTKYDGWVKTMRFNEQYLNFTGRSYLASYLRSPPSHHMWRADYFGQEHWVTTKEVHFESLPPEDKLQPIKTYGKRRTLSDSEPRLLAEHRVQEPIMNMTLKAISCAPRAFEIPNFLSPTEVSHILQLAGAIELKESTTGDVGGDTNGKRVSREEEKKRKTRTSLNSWVDRETSPIIDAIYRRSADLLRIDEALLRYRGDGEYPDVPSAKSIAESLQLVHYDKTQEYTAHHDFGYPQMDGNPMGLRFSTLLFYLNEPDGGGETSFPRWVNAETFHELQVTPEAGKAVLFYSQLPDGNMDDFSQHAAKPVTSGEKWLINLWVWDPIYEK